MTWAPTVRVAPTRMRVVPAVLCVPPFQANVPLIAIVPVPPTVPPVCVRSLNVAVSFVAFVRVPLRSVTLPLKVRALASVWVPPLKSSTAPAVMVGVPPRVEVVVSVSVPVCMLSAPVLVKGLPKVTVAGGLTFMVPWLSIGEAAPANTLLIVMAAGKLMVPVLRLRSVAPEPVCRLPAVQVTVP